jgi:S1-C subfamily serine protease
MRRFTTAVRAVDSAANASTGLEVAGVAPARDRTAPRAVSRGRRLAAAALAALACAAAPAAAFAQAATPPTGNAFSGERIEALKRAHIATVGVRALAVDDAFSNESLGRQRLGSGVVIEPDGLVLTISYLVLEAERVELEVEPDRFVPARLVGLDIATGFALLRPLVPVDLPAVPLGRSGGLRDDEPLMFSSSDLVSFARLVAQRPFSGTWEYHLDEALFTTPPRTDHSGAGLFNADGELVGIGSLVVRHAAGYDQPALPGNMFVPIDLLKPVLAELKSQGTTRASLRAWLGVHCAERGGEIRVVRVSRDSPAEAAGLQVGDRIVAIDGREVRDLAGLYKTLWTGSAERDVRLAVRRGAEPVEVTVQSVDRQSMLRRSRGI